MSALRAGDAAAGEPSPELLARTLSAAQGAKSAGQLSPSFCLLDQHGARTTLIDLLAAGPLVISFYRGVWCDFCDIALAGLARIDAEIKVVGARHVAIGPPPTSDAQRQRLRAFPMPVLDDPGLRTATAFGLTVSLPEELREQYLALGYVPPSPLGPDEWFVPVPATYVIGRDGRVVMSSIDADYRNRSTSGEILGVLRALRARTAV